MSMRACAAMLMPATLLAAGERGAGANQTASDAVPGSTGKGTAGGSASPARSVRPPSAQPFSTGREGSLHHSLQLPA